MRTACRPLARAGLPSPLVRVSGSPPPHSARNGGRREGCSGLFAVRAIRCARIPATWQGCSRATLETPRSRPSYLPVNKGCAGGRGSAGRRRARPPRPFRAPGQRTSRSPFAPGTASGQGSACGSRRQGGCEFSCYRSWVLRVALGPGTCHRPWGWLGPAQPLGVSGLRDRPCPARAEADSLGRIAPQRGQRALRLAPGCHRRLVTLGRGAQPEAGCRWGAKGQKQESLSLRAVPSSESHSNRERAAQQPLGLRGFLVRPGPGLPAGKPRAAPPAHQARRGWG